MSDGKKEREKKVDLFFLTAETTYTVILSTSEKGWKFYGKYL